MSGRTITLTVPEPLFQQLQARAAREHRRVEGELLAAAGERLAEANGSVAGVEGLTPDQAAMLADMDGLEDAALQMIARHRLTEAALAELEELHFKRQRGESLTGPDTVRRVELLQQYQACVLLRAYALKLLRDRGYDLTSLLAVP